MSRVSFNYRRRKKRGAAAWTPALPTTDGGVTATAWWDASQIIGLNDGDLCASWTDLIAGTYTATQTTAALKPTYKTAIQNGLPVLRFGEDATMDCLDHLRVQPVSATWFGVVAVRYQLSDPVVQYVHTDPDYTDGVWVTAPILSDGFGAYSQMSIIRSEDAYPVPIACRLLVCQPTLLRIDGSEPAYHETGIVTSMALNKIGGRPGLFLRGDIGEIVYFSSAVSAADINQVENYLNAKWAVY